MSKGGIVLSLSFEDDEHLRVGITKDNKVLANGIYSFLTMCSKDDFEDADELIHAFFVGVGEWMMDIPIDQSAFIMSFLSKCMADAQEQKAKIKNCNC